MAASPLYSLRTQRALNFGNADVPTIFKNIQLDIGAPHQFMDFRYKVDDAQHGEFWLDHCGALMDVEPMGEEFVHGMCHDIEDPTFDATAGATNPYAQVRPIHRPPRVPADRAPHCHWRVDDRPRARRTGRAPPDDARSSASRRSRGSRSTIPATTPSPAAGSTTPATSIPTSRSKICRTARSWSRCRRSQCRRTCSRTRICTASRAGGASTKRSRTRRRCSPAPRAWPPDGCRPCSASPATTPRRSPSCSSCTRCSSRVPTSRPTIEVIDDRTVRFALRDAPCFHEHDGLSWIASMAAEPSPALDAIARAINPRASSAPDATARRRALRVARRDRSRPPSRPVPSPSVELARISTGATVTFLPRRDLRT